jgi:hypothetical protein
MAIWYISGHLVYLPRFGMLYEKNLAALLRLCNSAESVLIAAISM